MTSDRMALVVLLGYVGIAACLVMNSIRRCADGWKVWLLFVIERLYIAVLCQWRARGRCPFPAAGGAIILANHRAPIDPLLLWMNHHLRQDPAARDVRVIGFLMAKEYYEKPGLIGWICRAMQSIPVGRDGRDMAPTREALRRLEHGDLIGIFPEGGINTGDGLRAANPGIAFLALKANVPIIPVYIHGVRQSDSMVAPFYTPTRIQVTYGTPIDLREWQQQKRSQEFLKLLTDTLMHRLADLGRVTYHPEPNHSTNHQPEASPNLNP